MDAIKTYIETALRLVNEQLKLIPETQPTPNDFNRLVLIRTMLKFAMDAFND